ncbi:MAG: F0F1 ATP synthase subunit B [Bacteroidales bacterium]
MSLFTPEPGLIIWMLISFFLVVIILGKSVWPSVIKAVQERSEFIRQGVEDAEEAARKLEDANLKEKEILAKAYSEQIRLMNETEKLRDRLMEEARQDAAKEKGRLMAETNEAIAMAKKDALSDIRKEVIAISIQLSEKILREDLQNKEAREKLIGKMLTELETRN